MGKQVEAKKPYTIMVRPSLANEYDKYAKKMFITRGQLMSNALEIGINDIRVLEALGVVRACGGIREMKEFMKSLREEREAITAKA